MPEAMTVQHVAININGSLNTGTAIMPLLIAPTAGQGGGFTLLSAYYAAGTTTGAGTAFTMELVHGGYRGTVLGGTVAAAIGGTASLFASDTIYAWTVSGTATFAAGDSLSVRKVASGVNMSPGGIIHLHFVTGR